MEAPLDIVCVPVVLHAFVVSEDFGDSKYRIAPLSQPNYGALRADTGLIKHDVMDDLDVSVSTLKAKHNPRFMDLTTGEVRKERMGVYLSWCLPQVYRAGILATRSAVGDHAQAQLDAGYPTHSVAAPTADVLTFRPAPNRWLVFRFCTDTASPPAPEGFVVESDRIRNINDSDLRHLSRPDVENITSPFIDPSRSLAEQQEIFIGLKTFLKDYEVNPSAPRSTPFTVVESANELFADYQSHNTSVFSIHDDLGFSSYKDPIAAATLSYVVIGFHADATDDPLIFKEQPATISPSHEDLLKSCHLKLNPTATPTCPDPSTFLKATAGSAGRMICHGTLNNVLFQRHSSAQLKAPSIELQEKILASHPIAVGTSTLDALFAYLRVSITKPEDTTHSIADLLSRIEALISHDDDVDSQMKATDMMGSSDWVSHRGERLWTFQKEAEAKDIASYDKNKNTLGAAPNVVKRPTPKPADLALLQELNALQRTVDGCSREARHLLSCFYCNWWKSVETRNLPESQREVFTSPIKEAIDIEMKRYDSLSAALSNAKSAMKPLKEDLKTRGFAIKRVASTPFTTHSDPTILFAGVASGWPNNAEKTALVRLLSQITTTPQTSNLGRAFNAGSGYEDFLNVITRSFPEFPEVSTAVGRILAEWADCKYARSSPTWPLPMYNGDDDDFKATQGWFPLYMEWSAEYHHIPWKYWDFQKDEKGIWSYSIKAGTVLADLHLDPDCRVLNGRNIIGTQASKILKKQIKQFFDQTVSSQLRGSPLTPSDRDALLKNLAELEFFSAPLAGVNDHLVTLLRGAHPGPSPSEQNNMAALGMKKDVFDALSSATDMAPYGLGTKLSSSSQSQHPFKPVTHGQLRLTKLHIVDKFGQVVTAIEPQRLDGTPATAVYPCTSPQLSCEPISGSYYPNTVFKADKDEGYCQFFQIAPRINQDARLNGHFVTKDEAKSTYRPVTEWENPIWGWLLVNYFDYSIQLFNPDGGFLREVFIAPGASSTIVSFRPSNGPLPTASPRLHSLLHQLTSYSFAEGFFRMVTNALGSARSTSADYPDFLPATMGKPFCLVDVGFSVELAVPPMQNQSLLFNSPPERQLLDYEFALKIGDANAAFDGIVGYFKPEETIKEIFTSFGIPDDYNPTEPFQRIGDNPAVPIREFPKLKPYFLGADTKDAQTEHWKRLQLFSVIVDPITPIHAYTGNVLPTKELRLPEWAVNNALKQMRAAFKLGPLLVPAVPLPTVSVQAQRGEGDPSIAPAVGASSVSVAPDKPAVKLAFSGLEDWAWLQPRLLEGGSDDQELKETWDEYRIKIVDEMLDIGASASTELVEGYMRMTKTVKDELPPVGV
ncbi:hypothetical protein BU16DRAFT_524851 [Lophium mytilinum]|uniref:Uncharacterized protein n=1 Tax=Lophium mytilinum TaxID=390894 RepID=A0A6A6R372_9PEZI|nr:hypothetical protein BU16DRAFT_524851 [Lophium mytilinum]